jgi:predicted O-linked N-acetylglucosamine transferase (SPINDLY family)
MATNCTWHESAAMSDEELAQSIRNDRIDIAIDLAGNTGTGRPGVFAMRAAPVQLSYLGYSSTTGIPEMDYFVTDEILDPAGCEDHYSEKLIRLGRVFATYTPPAIAAEVGPLPMEANGYVTFGSFAQASKITPATILLWRDALRSVPDARLILMSKGMQYDSAQTRLLAQLEQAGVDPARVTFRGAAAMEEYLMAHNDIDAILDTVPWNGHTTTMHALWMGVPTISLYGDRHVGRFAEMMLRALNLTNHLADTPAEFGRTAAALVRDRKSMAAFRTSARARLLDSELCDHHGIARRFEAACRSLFPVHAMPTESASIR